ncbi:hypothetical protein N7448_006381 [Penicillium atrosanguineum]|uniref:Uncharacterized protein n=1 Tax=Penicillium atrosanguineum TaxID=1132637 RepID=A0A9W9PRH4_9EURO|nr:uncharacterized protein N7443_010141 [Penicillium atrosanguineum]KAJ5132223.1 hypothetical protein N7448_006381 [Penicillium atrosanguineum]KAJ5137567.1 hypothetical protein N7526_003800 [Penicillium atrosanguineum]KAJ5289888.1 hypothetical protein N7443_010141 [Penicillium atrosanguineum]KAJ5307712.1 hypothetical protein N7476_008368 [Penicillium atrosanguineum]
MEDASSQAPFHRLPPNVIELILYVADANAFASLALLNRQWRRVSESPSLYAHHLAHCPSFAWTRGAIPCPGDADSLPDLKRQFLAKARQNAFDVFLRPRKTLVRLISSSMSSSTAFPQGEVFRFAFSTNGRLVLCISSSRIVVLDVATDPVIVKHEFQTRRRPMGATIQDDGSLLAVLSSTHRVNVYRLDSDGAEHIQTITLNDAPRDLTFSPTGGVLALSFEDSIEVHAIGEETLSTERRAARCPRVDALSFSSDGSMLLGSPLDYAEDGTVAITAPFYTESGTDASPREVQRRMWTTQILFPEIAQGFTHACLIENHDEADDNWIIGYDIQLAAFRAIRINNTKSGCVYFASPFLPEETRELLPTMLPTTDETGELVAFGFQDSKIWVYGVPGLLDASQTSLNPGSQTISGTRIGGNHHYEGQTAPRDNLAQLDKIVQQPKVLVRGRRVTEMHGITSIRWVRPLQSPNARRRLVAVAPGGVRPQAFGDEDVPVDGGRLLLLDFERWTNHGEDLELDIEVGETAAKILTEPDSSLDTEVELERRRTRLRRPDTDSSLVHRPSMPPFRGAQRSTSQAQIPIRRRNSLVAPIPGEPTSSDVVDIPYDNMQPRSQETLHRAATATASTRGRYDSRYRNTPSRRQIPHESDADNWVPPPPPYSKDPDAPLPEHLQQTLLPGVSGAPQTPGDATAFIPIQRAQITVARPDPQDRPRPQSAILQRLGTITGARLAGRNRRGSTTSPEDPNQELVNFLGTNAPPVPHLPQCAAAVNGSALVNQPPQRPHTATTPIVPFATGHNTQLQPLPTLAVYPAEDRAQNSIMAMPSLGATMLGEAYLPYSVSSPNLLHIPEPYGNALDVADNDDDIPARQRSFRRRVSTEPTSLPPSENEEWRRRIEDWNERTIQERSRRRRSKCIVM